MEHTLRRGRMRLYERLAFALVVLFALACLTTVIDRLNPGLWLGLKEAFDASRAQPSIACQAAQPDRWSLYLLESACMP